MKPAGVRLTLYATETPQVSIFFINFRKAGREVIATLWDYVGWFWFGYEVQGLEQIPDTPGEPIMVVYYHGALPIGITEN